MAKEWIIDVLGDLRGFAQTNDLPTLADQLEETLVVAVAEIGGDVAKPRAGTNGITARRLVGAAR